jgi:flagellar biosynthesis protein FlhG
MKALEPVAESALRPVSANGGDAQDGSPGRMVPGQSRRWPRHVVAIGGGKGGSGKTLVAVSLGIELAQRGNTVVLVDCDLGGPNVHSLLGMEYPRATLSDFVLRHVARLEEVVVPTPVTGLGLVSGARNALGIANPLHQQKLRLMRALGRLDADVVLLDLGAGTHNTEVDFFVLAHFGVLVVVPEPTSVENAYRFLKAAFLRRVAALKTPAGIRELLRDVMRSRGHAPLSPAELVAVAAQGNPALGEALERSLASFHPLLLVNQVREVEDLALSDGMVAATRRLFAVDLIGLGSLGYSDQVWRAVRAHQPVFFEYLGKTFTTEVSLVAERLLHLVAMAEADR